MSAETTPAVAAAAGPALEMDGLSVSYGRTPVVEGLTLAVPRGSVFALLGRNGAGKSSLLRVLLGQRPPARGRVRLLGEDPWTRRTSLMARVGVVPEEPDAPPEMTALALSALCGRLHARWDAPAVAERFRRFEVPTDQAFGRLSKGQKGAVMLALALGHAPELLLLDDPTLGPRRRRARRGLPGGDRRPRRPRDDRLRDHPRPAGDRGHRRPRRDPARRAPRPRREAGGPEGGAGPLARADLRVGGRHPGGGRRRHGGALVKKLLAVAARELRERWLALPRQLRARLQPPRAPGLRRGQAGDAGSRPGDLGPAGRGGRRGDGLDHAGPRRVERPPGLPVLAALVLADDLGRQVAGGPRPRRDAAASSPRSPG